MKDNIQAFPTTRYEAAENGLGHYDVGGMTLLDYFAAKAMQGEISTFEQGLPAMNDSNKEWAKHVYSGIANRCYNIADAMIEERKKYIP